MADKPSLHSMLLKHPDRFPDDAAVEKWIDGIADGVVNDIMQNFQARVNHNLLHYPMNDEPLQKILSHRDKSMNTRKMTNILKPMVRGAVVEFIHQTERGDPGECDSGTDRGSPTKSMPSECRGGVYHAKAMVKKLYDITDNIEQASRISGTLIGCTVTAFRGQYEKLKFELHDKDLPDPVARLWHDPEGMMKFGDSLVAAKNR